MTLVFQIAFPLTVVFALCFWGIIAMLKGNKGSDDFDDDN